MVKKQREYIKAFYYKNHVTFIISIISVIATGLLDVMLAMLLQKVMDAAVDGSFVELINTIWVILAFLLLLFLSLMTLRWAKFKFIRNGMCQYKNKVFEDITKKNISSFLSENTGSYISVLTNDATSIETNYLTGILEIINCTFMFTSAIVLMLWYSWSMTLVVILLSLLPMILALFTGNRLVEKEKQVSRENESFVGMTKDLLGGFTVIKSFRAEEQVMKQFLNRNNSLEDTKCKRKREEQLISTFSILFGFAAQMGIFVYGAYLSIKGQITAGVVIAFVQLMNHVLNPIRQLPPLLANIKAAAALIDKMAQYTQNNVDEDGTEAIEDVGSGIEFSDVHFAYDGSYEVLKGVSQTFEKSKSYAIVGGSGSGKSTMLNLLLGSSQSYKGSISVDGRELRNIKKDCLYDAISIIQQNVFIFDSSVEENISMYKNFDEDEIKDAIRRSGLESLIQEKGRAYLCGENGAHLSGGEKQRISIARCLLRRSSVLLMDEATAALDAETANKVTNAILDIEGLTRIIVTHKLEENILRRFDEIVVVKNGIIEERGSLEQLLENKGYFYSMFNVEILSA